MVKGKSQGNSPTHPLGEAFIKYLPEFVVNLQLDNVILDVHYSESSIHLYAYDENDKLILHEVFYVKDIEKAIIEFNDKLINIDERYALYERDLINHNSNLIVQKIRELAIKNNADTLPAHHGYETNITESSVIINLWVTLKDDRFAPTGVIEIELLIDDELNWTGDTYITLFGISSNDITKDSIYSKTYMTDIGIALDHFIWVIKDSLHTNSDDDLDELKFRITTTIFKSLDKFNILPF